MSDEKRRKWKERWTFTLSEDQTEWLKEKHEEGYNLSALMRKVIAFYLEHEQDMTSKKA